MGELGHEFNVLSDVTINSLGAFDHNSDGIFGNQSGGVRVAIFDRNTRTIVPGLDVTISGTGDPLIDNHRVRSISPVTLGVGNYIVVAKGYNGAELNGNFLTTTTSTDNASGAIQFVGGGVYGYQGAFQYPTVPDEGPSNRYLAGTFGYGVSVDNTVTLTVTDANANVNEI